MEKFEEIEVKRIKVVDEDGTVRMVVTSPPLPEIMFRGEPLTKEQRTEAGILFYNDEGTECGGLTFSGRTGEAGIEAEAMLAFDQYEQDQALTLSFRQRGINREYGMSMMERPVTSMKEALERKNQIEAMPDGAEKDRQMQELMQDHRQRLFVGRRETGEVCLYLMDSKGRARIRLGVDADDVPRMDFLNESGEVEFSFPPQA